MKKKSIIAVAAVALCLIAAVIMGIIFSPEMTAYDYIREHPVMETPAFMASRFLCEVPYGENDSVVLLFYQNKANGVSCAILQKDGSSYENLAMGAPILPEDTTTYRKINIPGEAFTMGLVWGILEDSAVTSVKIGDQSCHILETTDAALRIYYLWGADASKKPELIR